VESVTTDMDAHTLTVSFDDEHVSIENVVEALGVAGYTVPDKRLLN
jgi:copper chaperone CopZ